MNTSPEKKGLFRFTRAKKKQFDIYPSYKTVADQKKCADLIIFQ